MKDITDNENLFETDYETDENIIENNNVNTKNRHEIENETFHKKMKDKKKKRNKTGNISKDEDKEKLRKYIVYLAVKTITIIAAVYVLCTIVFGISVCHDNDNFPSIRDGDLCITYKLDKYISGDIVAYKNNGKTHYGKIIGVPGDVIDFSENGYTLNGNNLMETVFYKTELREKDEKDIYPLTLNDNEYYVLADMREEGKDSRNLGSIDGREMRGKMVLVIRRRGF
jgi:signal peptidase I